MSYETFKTTGDVLSVSTIVATLANWLPAGAAFFTIVWTLIRIYETKTVQRWIYRGQRDRRGNGPRKERRGDE